MDENKLAGLKIGIALTGSHCTLAPAMGVLRRLKELGADITPIVSGSVNTSDTKFGTSAHWREEISSICEKPVIDSIVLAEPIGPKSLLDILLIVPCSGNTIAKLAYGITDSPVLMAAKAHLRNLKPLLIAVSTNDGLGANAKNIGALLNTKNIYFVPFGQDNPQKKANSLLSELLLVPQAIEKALLGQQLQPVLLEYKEGSV